MKGETPSKRDFKATTDSIRHDAEHVARLEAAKGQMEPDDPRVDTISREVQHVATELVDKAKAERELAEKAGSAEENGRPN